MYLVTKTTDPSPTTPQIAVKSRLRPLNPWYLAEAGGTGELAQARRFATTAEARKAALRVGWTRNRISFVDVTTGAVIEY